MLDCDALAKVKQAGDLPSSLLNLTVCALRRVPVTTLGSMVWDSC